MAQSLSAPLMHKLAHELKDLYQRPEEGIKVIVNEDNVLDLQADFDGPVSTPFEGGLFRMKMTFGPDYPRAPPKGTFVTKIFHPNVSKAGEICVNVLKRDWSPDLGLRHILVVIRCLLIEPFPESALNEEAGKLLLEDYSEYDKHARLMTSIHAMPPKRSMPLSAKNGANAVNQSDGETSPEAAPALVIKKHKGVEKSKAAAVKKRSGLKRL
ncbi:hypothetical protein WJX73_000540 [Symbiochloris irregularis]|uniref:E2 ubiquitin-conjugating enzyme n=1 Tax=Symbiochloris irregularis TaxID=706552 RepID=A0AAW1P165_9CHLO